ncbi:MAG: hypothetical protein IJZ50_01665 [Alistipes sp.]|nr:hypothetical protein [Alistipes sp.]MBQ8774542.1 hypothetical protein [Alistipes sp.]
MKKIFSFAVLFAAMSLVACGGEQPKAEEAEDVAVEEVVVEEAPAAPVVKAEKAEKVEVAEKVVEAVESNVKVTNSSNLSISADAKKESQFNVNKEPLKNIDPNSKVGKNTLKVAGAKKVEEANITVSEGANLQVKTNGEGAKLTINK